MGKLKERSMIEEQYKWDLKALFANEEEVNEAIESIKTLVKEVVNFKGKIMASSDNLYDFYQADEKLSRLLDKVTMYTYLNYDSDTSNDEAKTRKLRIEKLLEQISEEVSFVTPEMLSVSFETVEEFLKQNEKLEKYRFNLIQMFKYKEHTLSQREEEIITKAVNVMGSGSEAFNCLNNTDVDFKTFKVGDEEFELTHANYSVLLNNRNREVRKKSFETMTDYYKKHINTITACLRGNIKEDFFISNIKKFASPLEQSLYADDIKIDVYNNLIETVHKNLDKMYDYLEVRRKALGVDELHMYDMHVDLIKDDEQKVPFDQGKEMVFKALKPLGEEYLKDLEKAFEERWIDVYPNVGKKSGAYSWGCYDSFPYLLLNYENNVDSVETMIHELGHSMHSYYTNKNQDYINHGYSIFLAEIASTVNEMLLNEYLYENASNEAEKILYLTSFLDKVRTTIFRQTMFAEFEKMIYDKEQAGIPLTPEELNSTYYELNKLYFGDKVVSDEAIKYEWARIPHFYSLFYVYKYATGLSAAIAITSDILAGKEGSREKYLEFLASGTSDYPLEILKRVDVDMTTTEPIQKAFDMFNEKLEKLKELI